LVQRRVDDAVLVVEAAVNRGPGAEEKYPREASDEQRRPPCGLRANQLK
jgi:hypothetical protein